VQVDPGFEAVDPALAFRDFQLLKLNYDKLLSNLAFNCNLRHYSWLLDNAPEVAAAAEAGGLCFGEAVQVDPGF
jgi:hypothetical protein